MERAAFYILLGILIWSPLAFGAVPVPAQGFMSLAVFAAALLLGAKNIWKDRRSGVWHMRYPATSFTPLFLLVLLYLIFQLLPLPESVLRLLSPEALVVHEKGVPASHAVATAERVSLWLPLAAYAHPVRESLILWVTYGLFFLGFCLVLNTRKRIETAVLWILVLACFETLYGLGQTYSGHHHIWWYQKPPGEVSGTYVNRNHFAGLMEMVMVLAVLYAAALSAKGRRAVNGFRRKRHLRARLAEIISGEQRFNKRAFVLFAGAVSGVGLIFSASRGGMIAGAGGLLLIGLLFLLRREHRVKGWIVLVLFAVISVYALSIGVEEPLSRFESFYASMEERERLTAETVRLFRDYPLAGSGIGSFPHVFPKYQPVEMTRGFVPHAHNDWVQLLAEAGGAGFLLILLGVALYLVPFVRAWRARHNPFSVCLGMAPLAALAAIGIHSWSDFNLHVPANFLMLAAVAAIGYSAVHIESRGNYEKSLLPRRPLPMGRGGLVLLVLTAGVIAWCGVWAVRHAAANIQHLVAASDPDPSAAAAGFGRAALFDPTNGSHPYQLALALTRVKGRTFVEVGQGELPHRELQGRIIRNLEQAVRLNPFHEEGHIQLAWAFAHFLVDPDGLTRWLPAADLSMERAAFFAGSNNPFLHTWMGDYWLMRSKTVTPASSQWEAMMARARWHYQKNLSLERDNDRKRMIEHIRRNVWVHYPDGEFVKRMLGGEEAGTLGS